MIYLDNAATTFPKPPSVIEAVERCISEYCGNPGRGTHRLALAAAERIYSCRELLSSFFNADDPERVIFTQNTTYALNFVIKGSFGRGDHILTSDIEHNAVRRPLLALRNAGIITVDSFRTYNLNEAEILQELASKITPKTKAIVCTHASNVCSLSLPIASIGSFCHRHGLLFVLDGAQSAGHLPIDMQAMHIDALAIPGHKGLYGIQGCGALLFSRRLSPLPLLEGGSGINSLAVEMPDDPPERYEPGTLPTPAIVALEEGLRSLNSLPPLELAATYRRLFQGAKERLCALPDVELYADTYEGSILLFNKKGIPAVETARRLAARDICVRAGLHCAPTAHNTLGTPPGGAVRISFGRYNTMAQLDALWRALQ